MHSRALDGIRGLAIALVLLHNVGTIHAGGGVLGSLLSRFASIGWVGVTLFFVLSGFLITRGLLQLGDSPRYFQTFFARRALRIFPLYYLTLTFFFLVLPALNAAPKPIQDDLPNQIWYWLYLTNWTQYAGLGGMALPHFWSLAVEEQFYLIWPLLLWRRSPEQVLRISAGVIIIAMLSRIGMIAFDAPRMEIYTFTVCRMDALAMGAVAAVWLHDRRLAPARVFESKPMLLAAAGALLLGRVIPKGYGMVDATGQIIGYALFGIAFTALLLAAVAAEKEPVQRWVRSLQWGALRSLGKYSYAIYVFHAPLHAMVGIPLLKHIGWSERLTTSQTISYLVVFTFSVYVLALVSYHAFEVHFLRLKEFFEPTANVARGLRSEPESSRSAGA